MHALIPSEDQTRIKESGLYPTHPISVRLVTVLRNLILFGVVYMPFHLIHTGHTCEIEEMDKGLVFRKDEVVVL